MKKVKKAKKTMSIVFFIVAISLMLLTFYFWTTIPAGMKTPSGIKDYILSFGLFAPVVFLLLMMLKVLFGQLLPGQLFGIASGYIFGVFWGTIISMSGLVIGTVIVVWLSRKFGRPFVELFVSKKILSKFDYVSERRGPITLFLLYLLPAFPDDAITFIAGLTRLPLLTIALLAAIGRLPGYIVLNMIGSGLGSDNLWPVIIIFGILMVISGVMYFYRRTIEIKLYNFVKRFKK